MWYKDLLNCTMRVATARKLPENCLSSPEDLPVADTVSRLTFLKYAAILESLANRLREDWRTVKYVRTR